VLLPWPPSTRPPVTERRVYAELAKPSIVGKFGSPEPAVSSTDVDVSPAWLHREALRQARGAPKSSARSGVSTAPDTRRSRYAPASRRGARVESLAEEATRRANLGRFAVRL